MRMKGYDYSREGLYFVTVCCQNKVHRFGEIEDGVMHLNVCGQIAHEEWINLTERFPHMELDEFVIMPDHIHGIISLTGLTGGATLAVARDRATGATVKVAPTMSPRLGDIVGAYKSLVTRGCLEIYKSENRKMGKLWQRNYHDQIIRDERAYHNISNYIRENPAKWDKQVR